MAQGSAASSAASRAPSTRSGAEARDIGLCWGNEASPGPGAAGTLSALRLRRSLCQLAPVEGHYGRRAPQTGIANRASPSIGLALGIVAPPRAAGRGADLSTRHAQLRW